MPSRVESAMHLWSAAEPEGWNYNYLTRLIIYFVNWWSNLFPMALIISDDILSKAQVSAEDLLRDLACYLYDKQRFSLGQARALAGLDQMAFQKELAQRGIDIHYTQDDLDQDLKNLEIDL